MISAVVSLRASWRTLPPMPRGLVIVTAFLLLAGLVAANDWRRGRVRGDFTQFSLAASRVLLAGENPYQREVVGRNYKYLPANAVLLYPLAPLPDPVAQGLWFALNTVLLVVCMRQHFTAVRGIRMPWWLLLLVFGAAFRLIWMNLKLGQWNLPVYCLALIGVQRLHRDRYDGALLVGLAATLKYMPAFFALYFVLRREWKKAGAVVGGLLLWALLVPSVALGPARHVTLLKDFVSASMIRYERMTLGERSSSLSLRSSVHRLLTPVYIEIENEHFYVNLLNLERHQAARVAAGVALAVAIGGAWVTFRMGRRRALPAEANLLLAGGWFLLFLMVSPGVRHAQLLTLTTPLFATAALIYSPRITPGLRRTALAGVVLSAFLITAPAELDEEARYQCYMEAWGCLAAAMLILSGLTVMGLRELTRPDREDGDSGQSTGTALEEREPVLAAAR